MRRTVQAIDAVATPHGIDRYVELVAPTWSTTEVRGRVTHVERQTRDTVTLTIAANRNWTGFEAGQYTNLTVEIDGVRHTRCYSMANSAGPNRTIELTIKAHPHGVVSNHLRDEAVTGMVVGLSRAQGSFTLPSPRPARLLLVSGGSGITPVLSMLRTLCDEGHAGQVTFIHYARTAADMAYRAELKTLETLEHPNLRVINVFTDAPGTGDLDGFVDAAQLSRADPEWQHAETYLCGPAPLMEAMHRIYAEHGIGAQLHTEAFTLPQFLAEAGLVGGAVRWGASERTVASDGRTLLDQAEASGLRPEFGCRMGICHTCTRTLSCGTVRDIVTGDITSDAGTGVRLCVSVPVGDVEIDL